MPYVKDSSSSGASDSEFTPQVLYNGQRVVNDWEYAGGDGATRNEPPLSEQLEPIAVIGMGCRLPGDVTSPADFWKMMLNRETGQTPKVPPSRFNVDAHFHENNDRPGSFGVLGGYFLNETLQEFDPSFFGLTPVEAMWMDPQQRKLLEVVYEAFESAGVTLQQVSGSDTACFMATFTSDFQQMSFKEHSFRHNIAATGVDPGIISNRISHVFNLQGPSIVVNTACSSSVYAIHNACNALRTKECSAAVVGGVNLILTVDQHMNTAKLGVLSPTSTCHTFNEYANGYGRAEGVGAVYLKRLSDAVRDGNPIRGVIRSSATNNNGKVSGVGITHPSYAGQCAVIQHAYQRGGPLDPALTGYFECHGTGTAIGDPLEVHAVADSMNDWRSEHDEPLMIGAVKTNIGHSEAASGLSAVIKAILAVERGLIPPTRGVTKPNSKMDWKGWKVKVPTKPMPFPAHIPVRRVSVNSFGYGGTNAHIIIEAADSLLMAPQQYRYIGHHCTPRARITRRALERNRPFLLLFSAHDKPTLKRNIEAHGSVVQQYNLLDLSHTLANCRTRFPSRAFAVTTNAQKEATFGSSLQQFVFADKKKAEALAFVFTGQGAQWARMGAELMTYYPNFLQSIKRMDTVLEELEDAPEWTLEDTLLEDAKTSRVNMAEFSQPLCTAVQIALVQLLRQWEITPSITCGHSSGEIAAAYAAGLISAAEAIVLAYYRGKVVRDINTNGSMLAVGLGAEAVSRYIKEYEGSVVVACHNSPMSVTLSGNTEALEAIQERLTAANIFARIVKTGGKAYHSYHMKPAASKYEALVRRARKAGYLDGPKLSAKNVRMVSSVTSMVLSDTTVLDETYWSANLLSPVLFTQAIHLICSSAEFSHIDTLVEVGPHSALAGPIHQTKTEYGFEKHQYLPSLIRNEHSAISLLKLAGELLLRDYPFNVERATAIEEASPSGKIFCSKGSLIVDLPPYQWDKSKRFWAEGRESHEHRQARYMRHDILGSLVPGCSLAEPSWRNFLRIRDLPWLKDHSLGGEAVFPAAGYFSMAMEAITQISERAALTTSIKGYTLRDVSIKQALVTPDDDNGIEVMLNMRPSTHAPTEDQNLWWDFNVSSVAEGGHLKEHMAGSIAITTRRHGPSMRVVPNLPQRASGKSWNQALNTVGFYYGPTFQDMENIRFDGKTYVATCDTRVKTTVEGMIGESRHVIHPASLDSCLQLLIVANWAGRSTMMTSGAVPIQVDEVTVWQPTAEQVHSEKATAFSWISPRGVRAFNGHSELKADDGELLMQIKNMRCMAYEAAVPQQTGEPAKPQPYGEMVWKLDVDSLHGKVDLDIASFAELVYFKKPDSRILISGEETVEAVLAKLPSASTVTAVAPTTELVDHMSTRFKGVKGLTLIKCDLSEDLESQSIKEGSYDLLIAPNNLHGNIHIVQRLLAPGGKAVLDVDGIHADRYAELNIPSTCISLGNGSTIVLPGKDTTPNDTSHAIGASSHTVHLVYREKLSDAINGVRTLLEDRRCHTIASSIVDYVDAGGIVLMLADLEGPLLQTITEQEFHGLQRITNTAKNLLWITAGGLLAGKNAESAMASGLIRSLTSEQVSLNAKLIDFDMETTSKDDIFRILGQKVMGQIHSPRSIDNEYRVSRGEIFISRLVPSDIINKTYSLDEMKPRSTIFDPQLPIVGKLQSGRIDFEMDSRTEDPLDSELVEVRVLSTGLNKEDAVIISGTDFPTEFSHEIGGTVTRAGAATSGFNAGDKVVGFSFDKLATVQRVHQSLLQKLDPGESLPEMTGLPMAYGAALYGLQTLAHLQAGEVVLVLAGTGLAGAAAVHITQAAGGYPYVIADGPAQADYVRYHFKLDTNQVLVGSEVSRLRQENGDYKADIIFSSGWVASSVAREAWRHIAPFGRFINCGRKDVLSRSTLDTVPLHRGAQYLSYDLLELHEHKPQAMAQLLAETINLYRQGSISAPLPLCQKNIADLNEAIASFSDGIEAGKTIIMHETSERTVNLLPPRPRLKLRADATYFLVGCLGGLGRSLTSWMMKKGARNFAFLSRSGADSRQASLLVDELKDAGATVQVFRGDAGVKEEVEAALRGIPEDRPVRGAINAAMVLKDGLFHNMPYESWTTSIHPKVSGTRNLHQVLQDMPLDFFVTTSSVSGILGTPGQSNYAAANSYLDSLARHRCTLQKSSVSIILPMILGIGVVAENVELEDSLKQKGMYGIDEDAVLDAFEIAIIEQGRGGLSDHLVVGLDPAELVKAAQEAGDDVEPFWISDARFSHTIHAMKSRSNDASAGGSQSILASLQNLSAREAVDAVRQHFVAKLARMLMLNPEDFEEEGRSVASYGIDSMIGAELRNWIFKELALDISFQQLLGPTLTISKFSEQVCAKHGMDVV
ncbi:KR domain-containing protein [Aspergillus tamarii]|uniref:KR domain-containing protein n=1 Tax=Aspergillus tamarii TaxID=41984 RepID=A0A5N6UED0_ASPTM|nr:KR domain-containing protein [Aspergillus tamarii]